MADTPITSSSVTTSLTAEGSGLAYTAGAKYTDAGVIFKLKVGDQPELTLNGINAVKALNSLVVQILRGRTLAPFAFYKKLAGADDGGSKWVAFGEAGNGSENVIHVLQTGASQTNIEFVGGFLEELHLILRLALLRSADKLSIDVFEAGQRALGVDETPGIRHDIAGKADERADKERRSAPVSQPNVEDRPPVTIPVPKASKAQPEALVPDGDSILEAPLDTW